MLEFRLEPALAGTPTEAVTNRSMKSWLLRTGSSWRLDAVERRYSSNEQPPIRHGRRCEGDFAEHVLFEQLVLWTGLHYIRNPLLAQAEDLVAITPRRG